MSPQPTDLVGCEQSNKVTSMTEDTHLHTRWSPDSPQRSTARAASLSKSRLTDGGRGQGTALDTVLETALLKDGGPSFSLYHLSGREATYSFSMLAWLPAAHRPSSGSLTEVGSGLTDLS